jgi:hypothetical protein
MNELPDIQLGYCASVHPAPDLPGLLANLTRYATNVRRLLHPHAPDTPMPVGLWLPANVAREILATHQTKLLRDQLQSMALVPFTFNGFPQGNFHEPSVKFKVYHPDWSQPQRLQYTLDLAHILADLLPRPAEGSISTLPLGWRVGAPSHPFVDPTLAAKQLQTLAEELARLREHTGNLIHVDLEPEPGCLLQHPDEVVEFFTAHLWKNTSTAQRQRLQDHIRLCHDICHSSVQFENQTAVLNQYHSAEIRIGKVQISNALQINFDRLSPTEAQKSLATLQSFAEPRYLHQTVIQQNQSRQFFDDLPDALASIQPNHPPRGQWRTHFHVPIFATHAGLLQTTQADIRPAIAAAKNIGVQHFEVETYAWSVLPSAMQPANLAEGLAHELQWLREQNA